MGRSLFWLDCVDAPKERTAVERFTGLRVNAWHIMDKNVIRTTVKRFIVQLKWKIEE